MKLEVENISKTFGGIRAVTDVSFTVEHNSITSIIGPNGAGKTTMFNCIAGFYVPNSGKVLVDGHNIAGMPPAKVLGAGLARTFQLVKPFHGLTVLETIMTAGHRRSGQNFLGTLIPTPGKGRSEIELKNEATATLEALDIGELGSSLMQELPYGQQRLVEIAKVLMTGAEILLLDEPAAGLHELEVQALDRVIRAIRDAGRTVLLIEHNMSFVMGLAEKVVVLDFGQKIAEGTPLEVRGNQDVIAAYLGKASVKNA